MQSVLIVSSGEKSLSFFTDLLSKDYYSEIVLAKNANDARRKIIDRDFDLVIINSPLSDEMGGELAKNIASNSICQVILLVKSDNFDEISAVTEDYGVFTVSKPVNKAFFWTAIKLASSAHNKLVRLNNENAKLSTQLADMKIISRAKCLLIEHLGMTEEQAHKYIEKEAMDLRDSKASIAKKVIKTYEG